MPEGNSYFAIEGESHDNMNSIEEFLLRCLLGAREEAHMPSNEGGFDEDVNVYLTGLLAAVLGAEFHERLGRYHFARDLDLVREVRRAGDERYTYRVYRTNADHLLLAIGLFHHVAGASRPGHPLLHREPRDFIGRGETYYALASSSLRRLRRRPSAVETALEKLAHRFEDYARILTRVRTSYFHLTERLGDARLYHLLHDPGVAHDPDRVRAAYDQFLDAYSAWRAQPDAAHHRALAEAVERTRAVDPDFAFAMPGEDENAAPRQGDAAIGEGDELREPPETEGA